MPRKTKTPAQYHVWSSGPLKGETTLYRGTDQRAAEVAFDERANRNYEGMGDDDEDVVIERAGRELRRFGPATFRPMYFGRGPSRPRHHATKKSPVQLQREINNVLERKSGRSHATRKTTNGAQDVMIVARPKDWDLIEESLRLDAESSAFDPVLRWQIGEALDTLEVGTTHQGRKVVARARPKDWKLLEETLLVDAQSKRLPSHEREDLQAALKRITVKPWPH